MHFISVLQLEVMVLIQSLLRRSPCCPPVYTAIRTGRFHGFSNLVAGTFGVCKSYQQSQSLKTIRICNRNGDIKKLGRKLESVFELNYSFYLQPWC